MLSSSLHLLSRALLGFSAAAAAGQLWLRQRLAWLWLWLVWLFCGSGGGAAVAVAASVFSMGAGRALSYAAHACGLCPRIDAGFVWAKAMRCARQRAFAAFALEVPEGGAHGFCCHSECCVCMFLLLPALSFIFALLLLPHCFLLPLSSLICAASLMELPVSHACHILCLEPCP